RAKRKKAMSISESEQSNNQHPRYVIRPVHRTSATQNPKSRIQNPKSPIAWHLTFNGHDAQFKHEQGAFYVAWLLRNPPSEPIHGLGVELKASAYYGQLTGESTFADLLTGKIIPLESDAVLVQRNLAVDDLEAAHALHREI